MATVVCFYPKLSGAPAATRCRLMLAWLRNEAKWQAACATVKGGNRKKARPLGLTATLTPEVEEEIVVWINDLRGESVPVSSLMLRLYAMQVAEEHDITAPFEASWWW